MRGSLSAKPGTTFIISYLSRLKAITELQEVFNVSDQGKDTGILNLTLTGSDPSLIDRKSVV